METKGYYALDTPFGRVWIKPTSKTHIYIDAGHDLNVAEEYPLGSRRGPITVNRVAYAFSGHVYLYSDGHFRFGLENSRESQLHEPYLSKVECKSYNDSKPSFAALDKVRATVAPLIDKWVADHPQEMAAAAIEDKQERIERALSDLKEAEEQLAAKQAEVKKLQQELRDLRS